MRRKQRMLVLSRPGKNAHRAKKLTQQLQQKRNSTVVLAWLDVKQILLVPCWDFVTWPSLFGCSPRPESLRAGRALLCQRKNTTGAARHRRLVEEAHHQVRRCLACLELLMLHVSVPHLRSLGSPISTKSHTNILSLNIQSHWTLHMSCCHDDD